MTLVDQLNIDYVNLTDTGFESTMTMGEFHAQPFGFLNGGATLAYCEAIAGMASNLMGEGAYVGVGQTVTAHHLKATKLRANCWRRESYYMAVNAVMCGK